ncbi:MAG: hypothetical protein HN704_18160 [Bacteroidetes bacterium]|jgi:hypothetical protein|nr:hypothetical protein [Bacteroidota bacterium]MBT6686522.1 hypothetical protein [Bacteroidota bacterium]MBT7143417.1 hypothetical protein [Bacteroidota bacterium]MBT7493527.1 hypothetical protein [Bacteroidota bacterium]
MRKIILSALLFCCIGTLFTQIPNEHISYEKINGKYRFYQNGKYVKLSNLYAIVESNEEALNVLISAKSANDFAYVLFASGAFLFGIPAVQQIYGQKPKEALIGIGVGVVLISIPLISIYNRKAKKAIDIYNNDMTTSSLSNDFKLNFAFSENGFGLKLRF